MALSFTLIAGRKANDAVRTRRYGALIAAEVTRWEEIVGRHGKKNNPWRLHFLDADGRFGRSFEYQRVFIQGWPVGSKIAVYRGPEQSWWVEDVGPRETIRREIPKVPAPPPE